MDINKILKGVECSCGKTHTCDIEYVYIEEGAISRFTEICAQYSNILLVADENTYGAAGEKVEKALADKKITKVVFSGKTVLIPDEKAIETVEASLEGVQLIIGIGSGVIQDLCKYVSHFNKIPYMVAATAPSMDGYASDGAAMILKGMKETVKAGLPRAIVADVDVLKNAPMEMIKAGYGDIVGKYSALNDWKLSRVVNDEYFCDYIYDTTYQMIINTLDTAKGLLNRDGESVKALTEALMVVGIMMSFAGSSRPASGSEHHLSHFFEIVGIVEDKPYFPHGIDVAYSTIVTAQVREDILKHNFPEKIFRKDKNEVDEKIKKIYKSVGEGCIALQEKIGNYAKDRISVYKTKEKEIREVLSEMPTADEIIAMLSLVELDVSEFYKMYGIKKIDEAVHFAKDLKDRYTVLWLYYDLLGDDRRMSKKFDVSKVKVIAMDLDGTLTQHKQAPEQGTVDALNSLSKKYKLLMAGAGQVMRIFNQLQQYPIDIVGNYGLQYGEYDAETKSIRMIRDDTFGVDKETIEKKVTYFREKYGYTKFAGENVEYHPSGCVTFPILGTKAVQEDKLAFDPDRAKRRKIYDEVVEAFSDYCVFVGGSSSFDMAPKPYNKYHALDRYCKEHNLDHENVVYIGDDYGLGGNDESVYLSDFPYLTIDDYRTFPEVVKPLLD